MKIITIFCLGLFLTSCDSRPRGPASGALPALPPDPISHEVPQKEPQENKEMDELSTIDEFMIILNDHRVAKGLRPLEAAPEIELTATNHARRMARKLLPFGHMGSKMRCRAVIKALGLDRGALCGENVAMGQENAQKAFEAWINSPDHREAIEDERYTHTGLGLYEDFRGYIYWSQIFVKAD